MMRRRNMRNFAPLLRDVQQPQAEQSSIPASTPTSAALLTCPKRAAAGGATRGTCPPATRSDAQASRKRHLWVRRSHSRGCGAKRRRALPNQEDAPAPTASKASSNAFCSFLHLVKLLLHKSYRRSISVTSTNADRRYTV